jgi:hypothetical protein
MYLLNWHEPEAERIPEERLGSPVGERPAPALSDESPLQRATRHQNRQAAATRESNRVDELLFSGSTRLRPSSDRTPG